MTRNLRTPLMFAAVLALVVLTARPGQAQAAHNDMAAMKQGMGAHMMADHQKMMADMKASQKKLDDLVAAMNQATGDDKVNKLAAVVSELVAKHREDVRGTREKPAGTLHASTPIARVRSAAMGVFVRSRRTVQVSRLGALSTSIAAGGALRFQNVYMLRR